MNHVRDNRISFGFENQLYPFISRGLLTLIGLSLIFLATMFTSIAQASPTGQSQHDWKIEALLAKAKLALSENRLYAPSGDNALDHLQEVLAIVPENDQAHSLLRQVTRRITQYTDTSKTFTEAATDTCKDYTSLRDANNRRSIYHNTVLDPGQDSRFRTYWTF